MLRRCLKFLLIFILVGTAGSLFAAFNVKDYGATGDGQTLDTDAINADARPAMMLDDVRAATLDNVKVTPNAAASTLVLKEVVDLNCIVRRVFLNSKALPMR